MISKKTGCDNFYDSFYSEKDYRHFKQDHIYISHLCSSLPLSNYKGSMVLDIGCGTGYWCGLFYQCGLRTVVGVDTSSIGLYAARKKYPRVDFILANAKMLPFKEKSFDLVLCQGLTLLNVDKLSSTESLGKELLRYCKENGLFVFAWNTNLSGRRKKNSWKQHKWENVVAYLNSLDCEVIETFVIDRVIFLRIFGRLVFNNFFGKLLIPTICKMTGLPGHLVCIAKKMPSKLGASALIQLIYYLIFGILAHVSFL